MLSRCHCATSDIAVRLVTSTEAKINMLKTAKGGRHLEVSVQTVACGKFLFILFLFTEHVQE